MPTTFLDLQKRSAWKEHFIGASIVVALSTTYLIPPLAAISAVAEDSAKLHPCAELTQRWAGDLPDMKGMDIEKDVQVFFSVKKKGESIKLTDEDDVMLFKSSGVKALDDYAIKCVQKTRSLKDHGDGDLKWFSGLSTDYLAVFNYKEKKAQIQVAPPVDYAPFMAKLQRSIKSHWYPPKEDQSKRIKCVFTVLRDGSVEDIKVATPGISEKNQEAAELAVRKAAPFEHLPPGSPQKINIEFVFDYNVLSGDRLRNLKNALRRPLSPAQLGQISHIEMQVGEAASTPSGELTKQTASADLSTYFQDAAEKIKSHWHKPEISPKTEDVTFSIHKDGSISDVALLKVTGNNEGDKEIVKAVLQASPLAALPEGAGETIQAKLEMRSEEKLEWVVKTTSIPAAARALHAYKQKEQYFPKLSLLWNRNTIEGGKNEVWLKVRLTGEGNLNDKDEPSISIYNTSGNRDLDLFAKNCITKSVPFNLGAIKNNSGIYIAKFDVHKMTAALCEMPDIDWSGYVSNTKRRLDKYWHPPVAPADTKDTLSFTLKADGTISDIKTITANVPDDFDKAARHAVTSCVPFWPFPGESPDAVNVQITFKQPSAPKETDTAQID